MIKNGKIATKICCMQQKYFCVLRGLEPNTGAGFEVFLQQNNKNILILYRKNKKYKKHFF